jgi:PAS domain S-box-containing protein
MLVAAGLGVPAWLGVRAWVAKEHRTAFEHWRSQLSAMAGDRRAAIETWVNDRLGDAQMVARYPTVIALASRSHEGPQSTGREGGSASRHVGELFALLQDTLGYEGVWVVGATRDLPVLAGTPAALDDSYAVVARRVVASGQPEVAIQLRADGPSVWIAAPVRRSGAPRSMPVGVILLSTDPHDSGGPTLQPARVLYRLVRREPIGTRTGEALLVCQVGPDVLYLSPLRNDPATPLTLRRPLATAGLAARSALAGEEGFGAFTDYRGVPVFAAVRKIRSTGWGLVVKVDQAEALAAYRDDLGRGAVVGVGLLLALAGIGFGLWRGQTASARLALASSESRFALLFENAEDAIMVVREDSRILNVNRRAEDLLGYARDEILRLRLEDVLPAEVRPLVQGRMETIRTEGGLVFETTYLARDGTTIPSEVASRFSRMNGEGAFLTVIRDIRSRRAQEERVAFLNRVLRTLTEINALMVRETDRERLLQGACRIFVEDGGFRMVWVGLLDPDTHWLVPAAFAGHEDGYLSERVTRVDDSEQGSGPAGTCIRSGQAVAVADLAIDESFRPWRELALRRGYRSLAVVPIRMRGQVAGALSLYLARASVFDAEVVGQIEGLADDIGFALESMDARREKEEAARALRESNIFLEALVKSAPLAVFTLKPDGRVGGIWNPAAERMFGWTREEAIGSPLPFVPPDRQDEFRALRMRVLAGEWFSNVEVTRRRRDGSPIEISIATAPIRGPDGRVVDMISVIADVTERKRMEAALRESEARFKRLAENAPDVIYRYRVAPDRALEYVNPVITGIAGYRPEEFYADPDLLSKIMHPEDRHLVDEAVRGELPPGAPVLMRWFHKDGSLIWTEIRNIGVHDAEGRVVALEGISRDVTQRVKAEETLRQLSAAVEQSPASVVITDTAGNIEYVNPAFTRLTGYSPEEVKGQNPRILKSGELPRKTYEELWKTITSGAEWRGEMLNRKKNGELYWEYASISAIVDEQGRPTRFLAVKEDITERKRAEDELHRTQEQLLQSQKIEAVGRLAGGVAHDFNNLLGVIIGHAELAQSTVPPPHPARARLEQVLAASLRAADLTRQLLAFSRRQVLQPRVLDLNSVVRDTEKLLRRLIGEDVELVARLAPDLGRVKVDPGQVTQVLMNLAVNARDAMPGGGTLTIETANVEVDSEYARSHVPAQPGSYVQLQVRDTGVGMDEAVRQRVFEPFFTTKPEGVGTGLGLSTVYGIVKQSGGYVWVESAPGRGTTFTIHLPRLEGPVEPAAEPVERDVGAKGGETVLVVEDQTNLRELICEVLADNGYTVFCARDAREALSLVDNHKGRIDLLLTDVVMPGMSGHELAEQLTSRQPEARVLYMSGYTSDIIAGRGVLAEGVQLLEKPFTSLSLTRHVRQALDSRKV